jgi:hypothetical protein
MRSMRRARWPRTGLPYIGMSEAAPARSETGMRLDYSREMFDQIPLPEQARAFPELRYMGSKHRLLPWLHGVLRGLDFQTAADPFAGSGSVAYLLKAMGKQVFASDFLNFPAVLASATVAKQYSIDDVGALLDYPRLESAYLAWLCIVGAALTANSLLILMKTIGPRQRLPRAVTHLDGDFGRLVIEAPD